MKAYEGRSLKFTYVSGNSDFVVLVRYVARAIRTVMVGRHEDPSLLCAAACIVLMGNS